MTRLRAAIGPLIIGLSAWCAAGHVTVLSAASATPRLAAPASVWWLIVATALAALAPAFRRAPGFAAPALVSTLPWWPVPLPAIALVFTGPLAWLPIGVAALAPWLTSLARAPRGSETRPIALTPQSSWGTPIVAGALTLALACLAAWRAAPRVPGGDEPSYLVITQSLLKDGDLKIENNHAARDYAAYFPGDLPIDYLTRGVDGQIYSIHAPGTSVLVLPAFALAGYRGAQWTILLVIALTGALAWRIAFLVSGGRDAAWFAWAAIVTSATFLAQSFTIFPDAPGALAVAMGLWLLVSLPGAGAGAIVATSVALAALPWLHTRFVVLAAGLGLLIVWQIWRDAPADAAARVRRIGLFLALPILSAAGWFAFFKLIYGTFNPSAPYGDTSGPAGTHLSYVPGGLVALLFDEQYGLFAYAPVLACAALGLATRDRRAGRLIRTTAIVAFLYLAAAASYWMWWAGVPAPPARFAMAVLPAFAAPLAMAWTRAGQRTRPLLIVLLAASVAISAIVFDVDRAGLLWNDHTAMARWLGWLGPTVDLARGWPAFFWRLTPGVPSTEWPFALQAAVAVGVFIGLWLVISALGDRRRWTGERWAVASAWWVIASLALAVQTGWWLTHATPLAPAASQSAMLARLAAGNSAFLVEGASIRRIAGAPRALEIDGVANGATWARFGALPAGTYELRVTMARPAATGMRLTIGSGAPLRTLPLLAMNTQTQTLTLPVAVMGLSLTAEDPAITPADVTLMPVAFGAASSHVMPKAIAASSMGSVDAYFLDDHVYAEPGAFWVKGRQTASFVAVSPLGSGSIVMTIANGGMPNNVSWRVDGADRPPITLAAGESATLMLAPAQPHGAVTVTLTSSAGFRPSDHGAADRRFLGVQVSLEK